MVTGVDEQAMWWRHPAATEWLAAEAQQQQKLLGDLRAQQVLELVPDGLPRLSLPEARNITLAHYQGYWRQPVRAHATALPILKECLDVVIWRYLEIPAGGRQALLNNIYRCLRPGGYLLMVTLNPLQPACWRACDRRQLGLQALDMAWPLRWQGFRLHDSRSAGGYRLLRPVRLHLLQKPGDNRRVLPARDRFLKPVKRGQPDTVPSCRAA